MVLLIQWFMLFASDAPTQFNDLAVTFSLTFTNGQLAWNLRATSYAFTQRSCQIYVPASLVTAHRHVNLGSGRRIGRDRRISKPAKTSPRSLAEIERLKLCLVLCTRRCRSSIGVF